MKRAKSKASRQKRPLRLEWIEAGSLAENPDNWRRHPKGQMSALKTVLKEVDWAGALLYNETTQRLIDGHARKNAVGPKTPVPVLIGRWTPAQEKTILATLDPLGAMASADPAALESLLADVDLAGPGMKELEAMLAGLSDPGDDGDVDAAAERKKAEAQSAARARKVSELYAVIVECKNEREQLSFYRRMQKEGRKCKMYML